MLFLLLSLLLNSYLYLLSLWCVSKWLPTIRLAAVLILIGRPAWNRSRFKKLKLKLRTKAEN